MRLHRLVAASVVVLSACGSSTATPTDGGPDVPVRDVGEALLGMGRMRIAAGETPAPVALLRLDDQGTNEQSQPAPNDAWWMNPVTRSFMLTRQQGASSGEVSGTLTLGMERLTLEGSAQLTTSATGSGQARFGLVEPRVCYRVVGARRVIFRIRCEGTVTPAGSAAAVVRARIADRPIVCGAAASGGIDPTVDTTADSFGEGCLPTPLELTVGVNQVQPGALTARAQGRITIHAEAYAR